MLHEANGLDLLELRDQFPLLQEQVRGRQVVYLDNASTTQKPWAVLRAMQMYYQHSNSNVHRGVHKLSQIATDQYEEVRAKIASFLNASDPSEIIFTKGCTESINLIASSWGKSNLVKGDVILLSGMEHHANIVPWQMAAAEAGAKIVPIPLLETGEIDETAYIELLNLKPKLVGIVHISNALGIINPVERLAKLAHDAGAKFLVDGAQGPAHAQIDVQAADIDFYSLTSHKMYGPTGVGAFYAKREILDAMPPYQYGGDMIKTVTWEATTFNDVPNKFEPGTPNIAGVVGWGAAIDWLLSLDPEHVAQHETELLNYATERLNTVPGLKIIGQSEHQVPTMSFTLDCAHPHDTALVATRDSKAAPLASIINLFSIMFSRAPSF
jgi:cysteine desulfurase/selenocysteine lyase